MARKFGYETKGSSSWNIGKFFASRFVCPDPGVLSSISVYLFNDSGSTQKIQLGIYKDVSGTIGKRLISTISVSIPAAFDNWRTIILPAFLELGSVYWLTVQLENSAAIVYIYYDAGDQEQHAYKEDWDFGTWPDNPEGLTYSANKISIYATYTPVPTSPYTWGFISKNQIDPERVESAIARIVGEHNDNEQAHIGEGRSLDQHKLSDVIDHVVASIIADKIKDGEIKNPKIETSARAYTFIVDIGGNGDYTDVQDAIDALPAEGGTILIKQGTYEIDTGLTITKNNVSLIGEGSATIIKAKDGVDAIKMLTIGNGSDAYERISISYIKFDGNKANVTGNCNGVKLDTNITMSEVHHCWFTNVRGNSIYLRVNSDHNSISYNHIQYSYFSGISLYTCSDNSILYNKCLESETIGGISLSQYSNQNLILGNDCNGNDDFGIKTIGSSFNVILDNTCDSNDDEGIFIASAAGGDYNIIHGNLCKDNGSEGIEIAMDHTIVSNNVSVGNNYGIEVLRKNYIIIIGNLVRLNLNDGITIEGGKYNTIKGNICRDNSQRTHNSYSEIILKSWDVTHSTHNTIEGNTTNATEAKKSEYGIREDDANQNFNIILGNICQNSVTANISSQGANSEVAHNIS